MEGQAQASTITLSPTQVPIDSLKSLQSSTAQVLVAIENLSKNVQWGNDAGIASSSSLLPQQSHLLSLLGLLSHNLSSIPPPSALYPNTTAGVKARSQQRALAQHLVHPVQVNDPATDQLLLSLLTVNVGPGVETTFPNHEPQGDLDNHERRRSNAVRVCDALYEKFDWKGRFGVIDEDEDEEDDDDDDDLFGDDEDEDVNDDDVMEVDGDGKEVLLKKKVKGKGREVAAKPGVDAAELEIPPEAILTSQQKEEELKKLMKFMTTGK